ncbi:hypothetical protein [Chamaesiphon minutus]|uniref:Uncharacterized protein n=1 Tax=Chamaesiphon minutus (strain ATCC 27169 / PCC 6605) TaxID=1173020 RepID=K9UR95_CHAP6|nr:hypothetical protein [Chamaesiphon minutus]AFY97203.1 hypothetical protein Cha6605_6383 [Chamaesiphon minutus PCC 6605]
MPKKVGHNCFQCSKLSTAEAGAKPCWDAVRCPNRRHYQRNKARISQQRKQSRPVESAGDVLRTIAIEPPIGTAVSIIFYRERQDAPVHAIAAEVWQGTQKVLKVEPMHCMGLTPVQVVGVMTEILKACSSELGVELTKFTSKVELHPSQCPISSCPQWHHNN